MKFFLGLFLGFGLGVTAGLILAPQSGEATLSQFGEQGVTLRERTAGLSNEIRARASEAMVQGVEMYNRTKDELSERYTKAKTGQL